MNLVWCCVEDLDLSLTEDTLKLVRSVADIWEGDCSLELWLFICCETWLGLAKIECLVVVKLK